MSLWSSMCFAFSGFEISSMVGQEVNNPRRTIPRSIVLSGIAVTAIYILSSASVLVAVPASELAERSGIADAVELVAGRLGLAGHGRAHRPAAGRRVDRRHQLVGRRRRARAVRRRRRCGDAGGVRAGCTRTYRTPHVALIVQALATTAAVPGQRVPVGRRRRDDDPGGLRHHGEPHHPGLLRALPLSVRRVHPPADDRRGDAGGSTTRSCCRAEPPARGRSPAADCSRRSSRWGWCSFRRPGPTNVLNYEANLIGQAAVLLGIGLALYFTARRRSG